MSQLGPYTAILDLGQGILATFAEAGDAGAVHRLQIANPAQDRIAGRGIKSAEKTRSAKIEKGGAKDEGE